MNAHKVAVTLTENGKIVLTDLPFQAGETLEIIILEQPKEKLFSNTSEAEYPLQGKQPYHYEDPFEPAVTVEDWEVFK